MEQPNNEENLQGLLLPAMSTEHSYDDDEEEDHERSAWETPVRNLDTFFTSMYHYHNNKGLPTILLSESCAVISLGFTTAFSTFLIGFVDWSALKHCHDESSCGSVSTYIISHPFRQFSTIRNMFIIVYSILLITFWCWRSFHAINTIRRAILMEKFYREKLGILMNDLTAYTWDDVVERLIKLHDSNIHRVAVKDKLTVHDVVLRIMRKENFMIGLINQNILDLRVPWWVTPFISEKLFLTKSLEWSLSFCILEYMFNDQFNISTLFLKDVNGLQGRFIMVGLIHLALLPFMLIFMSISFFLQNAQTFHSNKAYLGPRQWSPLALWTFREFNEVPHLFETRMNRSYTAANEYINSFQNENVIVLAKTSAYISGAFIATFLLISVISEGVFLFVLFGEHNLLWWLGVFSAIYAGSRSIIPDETKVLKNPELLMTEIASYTHYFPSHWHSQCHTLKVRNEFASEFFPFKIKLFFMEICSVVLTPLVLCFSLPQCTPLIIEFVRDHARYVEGVGAVCDFALFEFDRYGDTTFGAPMNGYMESSQRAKGGKMEQSFLNFQQAHPQWAAKEQGNGGRKAFLDKLQEYKMNRKQQGRETQLQQSMMMMMFSGINNNNNNNTNTLNHHQNNGNISITGSPISYRGVTGAGTGGFTGFGGGVMGYNNGNGFNGISSPKTTHTTTRLTLQQQQHLRQHSFQQPSSSSAAAATISAGLLNRKWTLHGYSTNNNNNSTANNNYTLLPTATHDDDNNELLHQPHHPLPPPQYEVTNNKNGESSDNSEERKMNENSDSNNNNHNNISNSNNQSKSNDSNNNNNNTISTTSAVSPLLQQSNAGENNSYLPSIPFLSRQNSDNSLSLLQSDILLHSNMTTNTTNTNNHHNFTTMYGNSTILPQNNSSNHNNSVNVSHLLRSILNQENIDYENDFYWLNRFHAEQQQSPPQQQFGSSSQFQHTAINNNNYNNNEPSSSPATTTTTSILPRFPSYRQQYSSPPLLSSSSSSSSLSPNININDNFSNNDNNNNTMNNQQYDHVGQQ